MNEDFNKKMGQYISKRLESESDSSKELVWNRLNINETVTSSSSKRWALISAILFLLLLLMSGLYFCNKLNSERPSNSDEKPVAIIKDNSLRTFDHVVDENKRLKSTLSKLKDSLTLLTNQIDIQESKIEQNIIYKDRLVFQKDTLYIKSEPIIKYKNIIERDTIYLQEPPVEQPMASVDPDIIDEKNRRRNVVLFDLRNQVEKDTPSKEESKATITFSLNSN